MGNTHLKFITPPVSCTLNFGKTGKSCLSAYVNSEFGERDIIIAYEDSVEIWNYVSGDRRKMLVFEDRKINCFTHCMDTCLGPISALAFNDGSIIVYSSDFSSIRRTFDLTSPIELTGDAIRVDGNDFEMKDFSSLPLKKYATALNACEDVFLYVGDNFGSVHVFDLRMCTNKEAVVIQLHPDEGSGYLQQVVGAVRINGKKQLEKSVG